MSDSMIPISEDALQYCTLLFELNKPVVIPASTFEEVWPYVDSIYRTLPDEALQCNGELKVQKYECRLRKSAKSGTTKRAPEDKVIKRRHSSIRDKGICNVRMKVSRLVDGSSVTIERLDSYVHTHDIEESFRIKKPTILLEYLKSEAAKNYSTAQIYHAFRGAGTHKGSECLGELSGSSLKRQDITNLQYGMGTSDDRMLGRRKHFHNDILEACNLLIEQGWLFEQLQVVDSKKEERWGLVFAQPARLSTLARRGWFTQFDATHKPNHWNHNMFSFLVRNEYNIWILAAHLVVERENGEVITEGLKHIKRW